MTLPSVNKELVQYYQRQRDAARELVNTHLMPLFTQREIQQGAKELALLHGSAIILDYDYEFNILIEHCLFFPSSPKTVMDRAIQKGLFPEDSNEMKLLKSLKQAHYSIFMLEASNGQVVCPLLDLLSGEKFMIIDTALGLQTKQAYFTSQLIPIPDTEFWMTTNSLLPILKKDIFQDVVGIIKKFQPDIEKGKRLARNRQKLLSRQITRYLLRNDAFEMAEMGD